jgi:3-oxoacyl-[acyl-carrier-protein] synthase-3
MSIGIIGTASYVSKRLNPNSEVCEHVDGLTEDWIIQKTGIKRRFHGRAYETSDYMAIQVARTLAEDTPDIGLVIITSFSQEYMFPPLSAKVHSALNLPKDCQVMDINVNCVGLVTGTTVAVERMKSDKRIKHALVIGVEVLSKFVDKADKFTAPFFSDGASGVLLGRVPKGYGLLNSAFATDSTVYEEVKLMRGKYIYQNGKATWTQAITNLPYVLNKLMIRASMSLQDVDFFIFHQANKVMIEYVMDKNKIPREKTYTNIEEIGNTGAASIGIALDEAWRKGLIRSGSTLVLAGIGAGFNFGANLWKIQ